VPLDPSNNSEEHLLPYSIGWRRTVSGILCSTCNNVTGGEWDSALNKQVAPYSILAGIKGGNRGGLKPQVVKLLGGDELTLRPDGSKVEHGPRYEERVLEDGTVQRTWHAKSEEDLENIIKSIRKGNPNLDETTLRKGITRAFEPAPHVLELTYPIQGASSKKSLVKAVVCLAAYSGVPIESLARPLRELATNDEPSCLGPYHAKDLIAGRQERAIAHCLAISNRNTAKQLLGYVEIFGVHRFVVELAKDYTGPNVHAVIARNPVTGEDVPVDVNLALTTQEVTDCLNGAFLVGPTLGGALDVFKQVDLARQIDRCLEIAWKRLGAEYGIKEGDNLTEDQVRLLPELFTNELRLAGLLNSGSR
jgi:hypothetical protein